MANTPADETLSHSWKAPDCVMPPSQIKAIACSFFHATIADFYVGDRGDCQMLITRPTVYDLLYGAGLKAVNDGSVPSDKKPSFRWYHLPANNMTWSKDLINKLFDGSQVPVARGINEDWTKREHRGLTAHSRFIRPMSRHVPSLASLQGRSEGKSTMMLFETIQQVRNAGITIQENERGIPWESLPITAQPEVPPDTLLIRAYFDLHIRRTLDQYFYTGMKDTTARDQDQVVNRVQRGLMNEQPKIIVVDQLWLWILNEECIVTSFPQSGDDSAADQDNVLGRIMVALQLETVSTVHELSALTTSHCIGAVNYERVSQAIEMSKIVDKYDESLQRLFSRANRLFGEAIDSTYQLNRKRDEREQNMFISALTSRNMENNLLIELRDIRDELEIISLLHDEQTRVIRDMGTTIGLKDDHMFQIRYKRLRDEIDDQVVDVVNLLKLVARIAVDINQTVELKQSTIIANEAEYSLTTNRQLARESSKQGKIILLFTIVTIIFLPMSFLAAFFAIPIVEYPKATDGSSGLHLSWVCKYVFGLTAAVAGPLIILGLNFDRFERWWVFTFRRHSIFRKKRKGERHLNTDSNNNLSSNLNRNFDSDDVELE